MNIKLANVNMKINREKMFYRLEQRWVILALSLYQKRPGTSIRGM